LAGAQALEVFLLEKIIKGGISIKDADDCIYIAPSGVQKELVRPEEMF
jgi:hypothetical protein